MNALKNGQRLSLVIVMLVFATLTGCATSIDPARMSMMVTHSVSPKSGEGMATSETLRCRFRNGPISKEAADRYLKEPSEAVKDGVCNFDEKKEVVQGSPTIASQVIVGAANAVSAGVVTYGVQATLQREQQQHCLKNGGCGTSIVNNNNGEAVSTAGSQAIVEGVKTVVTVTTPATPASCGKGCLSGK